MKFPAGREEREKHSLLAEGGEIWPGRRILAEEERSGWTSAEELRSDSRLMPAGSRPKVPLRVCRGLEDLVQTNKVGNLPTLFVCAQSRARTGTSLRDIGF